MTDTLSIKDHEAQARIRARQWEFESAYEAIKTEVPFNLEWNNGTGYYDGAIMSGFGLRPGKLAKSYDPNSRRRIIFIGTRFGNLVLFERYTDGKNAIYVHNANHKIELIGGLNSVDVLSGNDINRIVGMIDETGEPIGDNIGLHIEAVAKIFGV